MFYIIYIYIYMKIRVMGFIIYSDFSGFIFLRIGRKKLK